jgi:DNA-binding beta-propeller fold protein YncE
MKTLNRLKYLGFVGLGVSLLAGYASHAGAATVTPAGIIDIPGVKFSNFDISFVDPKAGQLYLSDRSNAAIDVFDTNTDKFLYRVGGFVGFKGTNDSSGPDGVLAVPDKKEVWAGDGDSTMKVIDVSTNPGKLIATIPTGGTKRLDEMAYDPKDGIVLAANDVDEPGFVTLFSTKDHSILSKIVIPEATDGIEQTAYVAKTDLFYISIPSFKDTTHGAIAVVSPKTAKVLRFMPVMACEPSGLVQGPGKSLLVGCAGKKGTQTVIIDRDSGKTTGVSEISGEDEVAYNPTVKQYYTASRDAKGGPFLGVIDASTKKWVANLPTGTGAHSVAADSKTNKIFVPLAAGPACPTGCVAVYQAQ